MSNRNEVFSPLEISSSLLLRKLKVLLLILLLPSVQRQKDREV